MAKRRVITNDVLQRVSMADQVLSNWMRADKISEVTPEDCMSLLVEKNVYEYDMNNRGHYFREDLRTLRDNSQFNLFTDLIIEQKAPGSKWYIKVKNS